MVLDKHKVFLQRQHGGDPWCVQFEGDDTVAMRQGIGTT
jgi:hypothetical protein